MHYLKNMLPTLALAIDEVLPIGFFIAFLILAVLLFAAIIFGFVFSYKKTKKRKNPFDMNVRIYTYDYAKRVFTFFDQANVGNRKAYSEDEFYSQFVASDRYRVQNWLEDVTRKDDYPKFMQADLKINRKNQVLTSMMELSSVNKDKHVVHFESHLLPYLSSTLLNNKKKSRKFEKYVLQDKDDCQDFLDQSDSNATIGIYYLRLFRSGGKKQNDEAYLKDVYSKIIDSISRFLSPNFCYYKISDNEGILLDRNAISKVMVMTMGTSLNTMIQQFLNFSVPDADLYVAIGITTGTISNRNFEKALEQSSEMAKAISNNYTTERVLLYNPQFYDNYSREQKNLVDVSMVVKNATFRLYFLPTFNISTGSKSFYVANPIPYGTEIDDFQHVLEMSVKTPEGPSHLFENINEKCKQVLNGKNDSGVLLEIPFSLIKSFLVTMKKDKDKRIDWILAIREIDLLTYMDDINSVRKMLHTVLLDGYKIAIILHNANTTLPSVILRFASYFIVGTYFTHHLNDSKIRNDLRLIQNNYTNYPAVLTYYGLENFNSFELAVHYGGTILQCDELAGPSSRAEELDSEKIAYLLEETVNLIPKKDDKHTDSVAEKIRQNRANLNNRISNRINK